ncbi:MAG TPA: tetratricopeptide repeat protein [Pyrinomonadaceae bacterium]|nr:tetratricopeptide repeat protein [Pyrinomonadaceae bacterium]
MTEEKQSFFERYSTTIIVVGLVAVCLAIYGQTYRFDFINIDDRQYIYENPVVASGLNSNSIWWAFTAVYSGNWHPVTWLTHLLDVQLYGMNAGGHHATNVIIHTLASVLAYSAFNRLTGTVWQSAAVAALFAVHPAHVESVAWIAERRDVLTGLFMMLTLITYTKFVASESGSRRKWMGLTSLCLALGLMSKGMLVTMPFVLLLCDYWPLKRLNSLSDLPKLLLEKAPLFILIAASAVMTYYAQSAGGAVADLATMTLFERLQNVVFGYTGYLAMFFWPFDLGVFYPISQSRPIWLFLISVILLLVLTIASDWFGRSRRYLTVGWLWFVGMMVPVSGIVQIGGQSMADRYTYVPYFGLFIIVVWGIADIARSYKLSQKALAAICIIVIAVLGIRAFDQASKWQNSETLYRHTLAFTKNNNPMLANLCLHYVKKADPQTAERQCTELLAQMPETADGYNILGTLAAQNGKFADARTFFEKAIAIRPDWGILHLNLAMATAKAGDPMKAMTSIQLAAASTDGSVMPQALSRGYFTIAGEFERKADRTRSIETLAMAVEIDPTFVEAANLLERMRASSK